MKKHYRHENDCLNCGAELQGKFCHNCGQENLQIKESFGHMLNHAVSDYFHFDHQFFHTLKPLLFQPGKLTIEYLNGRRAQYLHPVKMYIFISLVFFLLVFKTNHEVIKVDENRNPVKIENGHQKDGKNAAETKSKQKRYATLGQRSSPIIIDDAKPQDSTYAAYQNRQSKLKAEERDGFWSRFYIKTYFAYQHKYGENASEMFTEDVRHSFPKMMFVLLPLFALILRFTFWRNHKFYVEHIIYSIHLHCFIFLSWSFALLIEFILPGTIGHTIGEWLSLALSLASIYYIYRSLRVVYNRSRWITILKMFTMSLMYWILFAACAVGLVMIVAAQAG